MGDSIAEDVEAYLNTITSQFSFAFEEGNESEDAVVVLFR